VFERENTEALVASSTVMTLKNRCLSFSAWFSAVLAVSGALGNLAIFTASVDNFLVTL
jgi:hypothetical protein